MPAPLIGVQGQVNDVTGSLSDDERHTILLPTRDFALILTYKYVRRTLLFLKGLFPG